MSPDLLVEEVNEFLSLGGNKRTNVHYDMNAIKIRLNDGANQKVYLFYVYSPWRIVHNDVLVNSSHLYPYDEYYESREDHKRAFAEYCQRTRDLEHIRIQRIDIKPKTNDLTVEWESGHRLEKVCMADRDYHIYGNAISHDFGFNSYAAHPLARKHDWVSTADVLKK